MHEGERPQEADSQPVTRRFQHHGTKVRVVSGTRRAYCWPLIPKAFFRGFSHGNHAHHS